MSLTVAPFSLMLSSTITSRRWAVQIPKRTVGVALVEVERHKFVSASASPFSRSSSSTPTPTPTPTPMLLVPHVIRESRGNGIEVWVEMILLGLGVWIMLGSGEAAQAFGPQLQGPLLEEFWENMRRYGLYFITVGTGALYTILKPIYELLKTPTSALFIILIISASLYLLYLVLTAMIGLSDFSYQYAS